MDVIDTETILGSWHSFLQWKPEFGIKHLPLNHLNQEV